MICTLKRMKKRFCFFSLVNGDRITGFIRKVKKDVVIIIVDGKVVIIVIKFIVAIKRVKGFDC